MIAVTAVNDRYHSSTGLSFENLFKYGKVFTELSNRGIEVPDGFATYRNDD